MQKLKKLLTKFVEKFEKIYKICEKIKKKFEKN